MVVLIGYIVAAIVLAVPVVVATLRQPELLFSVLIPYVAVAGAGVGAMVYLASRDRAVRLRKLRIPTAVREQAPKL
jgi:hypothetical protein